MYLLLDTSTALCQVWIVDGDATHAHEWQADRQMAKGLLRFLDETAKVHGGSLQALAGIGVFRGPGSFTGIRIGAATANTLAAFGQIPVVGTTGEQWRGRAIERLQSGQDDQLILPKYGRPARITQAKK